MGSAEGSDHHRLSPTILPLSKHGISAASISKNALSVLYRLKDSGFQAYIVGGGVRDLLLGREPKDFDVVTDAHPEQVRSLFRNCRLIGRRFRLAHVYFGRDIIEVATFRAIPDGNSDSRRGVVVENGRVVRDNVYGSIEEDAQRRDFTVNSLYFDVSDLTVADYVGALQDLEMGVLRVIGKPVIRFQEDPVRMLRAVRFAAKLGFLIHPDTEAAIFSQAHLLESVPPARLFDEIIKLFHGGCALKTFELLRRYELFSRLFPATELALAKEDQGFPITFIAHGMQNTDERINSSKPVTPAFLYAVLLWEPIRELAGNFADQGSKKPEAFEAACVETIRRQNKQTSIPRRFAVPMREIWQLQYKFQRRSGKQPLKFLAHPRFRAAYDFFCLRTAAGELPEEVCIWWTRIQELDSDQQRTMVSTAKRPRYSRRKPRAKAAALNED